ncbi:sensor domain-containing diguanylate cyclase [Thalassolituus sp. LLYu03]|uniref:sensor domain-containing diguanylate cyclase n=1 Tax=Thalassolituus sp. LLYu03 TaxID=3421656 RepID=UPI003D27B745
MELNDIDPVQLLGTLQQGIVVHCASTEILYANPKALELLRLSEAQALGKDALDPAWHFIDNQHNTLQPEQYPVNRVLASKTPLPATEIGICDSSTSDITWVLCNAYPQFTASGDIEKVVVGLLDISAQKTNIPFEAIVAKANDVIVVTSARQSDDTPPQIVYVNRAFTELTGYQPEEVIGKTPRLLQGEGTSAEVRARIREAIANKQPIRETLLNYSRSGVPYWLDMNIFPLINAQGDVTYFAAVERDATSQVDKEAELEDLANRDPLTGLLNRRGFYDIAREKLAALDSRTVSTIAMIDVDYFKNINDHYGHKLGDLALVTLAKQLRNAFRGSDIVCRFGGEEFLVLLLGADVTMGKRKLEIFRNRIEHAPLFLHKQHAVHATVSIGVTHIMKDAAAIEAAINAADTALYEAKRSGRNRLIALNHEGLPYPPLAG